MSRGEMHVKFFSAGGEDLHALAESGDLLLVFDGEHWDCAMAD